MNDQQKRYTGKACGHIVLALLIVVIFPISERIGTGYYEDGLPETWRMLLAILFALTYIYGYPRCHIPPEIEQH